MKFFNYYCFSNPATTAVHKMMNNGNHYCYYMSLDLSSLFHLEWKCLHNIYRPCFIRWTTQFSLHYFQLNIIYALLILIFLFLISSYMHILFNESLLCRVNHAWMYVQCSWCDVLLEVWKIVIIMINSIWVDIASDVSLTLFQVLVLYSFFSLLSSTLLWAFMM